jgi:hypothetical protein
MKKTLTVAVFCLFSMVGGAFADQHVIRSTSIDQAILLTREYIDKNIIDVSKHYIASASYYEFYPTKHSTKKLPAWRIEWRLDEPVQGGQIYVLIFSDGSITHKFGK